MTVAIRVVGAEDVLGAQAVPDAPMRCQRVHRDEGDDEFVKGHRASVAHHRALVGCREVSRNTELDQHGGGSARAGRLRQLVVEDPRPSHLARAPLSGAHEVLYMEVISRIPRRGRLEVQGAHDAFWRAFRGVGAVATAGRNR